MTTARTRPGAEQVPEPAGARPGFGNARRPTRHHAVGTTACPDAPAAGRAGAGGVLLAALVPARRRDLTRVQDGTR